jgi:hypothetical protein
VRRGFTDIYAYYHAYFHADSEPYFYADHYSQPYSDKDLLARKYRKQYADKYADQDSKPDFYSEPDTHGVANYYRKRDGHAADPDCDADDYSYKYQVPSSK